MINFGILYLIPTCNVLCKIATKPKFGGCIRDPQYILYHVSISMRKTIYNKVNTICLWASLTAVSTELKTYDESHPIHILGIFDRPLFIDLISGYTSSIVCKTNFGLL